MFKVLFLATLFITLVVNIIFLIATKDKPPDLASSSSFVEPSSKRELESSSSRRLFLRSNDLYDYSATATSAGLASEPAEGQAGAGSKLINHSDSGLREHVDQSAAPESASPTGWTVRLSSANGSGAMEPMPNGIERNKVIYQDYGRRDKGIERSTAADDKAGYLNIRVKSSRNHVLVSANDIVIHESKSEPASEAPSDAQNPDGRGIHVLVLNQFRGSVMARRVFDTYLPRQDDELTRFLSMVSEGRILVLAVKDEASFKMGPGSSARRLLRRLGSEQIGRLRWRDMWAFVGRKRELPEIGRGLAETDELEERRRANRLAESLSKSAAFADWGPALIVEARVELLDARLDQPCKWPASGETERRRAFCSSVEGYGRVCDCDFPAPISFKPTKFDTSDWQLAEVPILVMASNRPHYLYRMLRSLLAADGLNSSLVSVFVDGPHEEPVQVSQLFELRAIQGRPQGLRSGRISHHYRASLATAFERHPRAQFVIIFEEDLDVAPDALLYFNQTLPVLRQDPSLYCVSAWNDQGYEHSAHDPQLIYRVETMPGLGWMLSRDLFKRELEPRWPAPSQPHDWDMWIRTEPVRRGRECLIPDVSRTYHFGSQGTNINSYFQQQYFSKHAFNRRRQSGHFGQLAELARAPYERLLERTLAEARVYGGAELSQADLCALAELGPPTGPANASTVIYIEMIDERDFANWLRLAKCWRIWDLDARGQHRSMWRLFLAGRPVLVVGVPASPYARFKPAHLSPFRLSGQP